MAVIGSLALSVVARTERLKQDMKPALDAIKDWGVAAEKAGLSTAEVNREMGRMRAEAARGPKEAAAATASFEDKLRKAKVGAAALSGAISAMSSEMGGAAGHAIRLGTSLTSAFLAGGPVAFGITAIAAGISSITGAASQAAAEINRITQSTQKMKDESSKAIESMQETLQRKRDELAVSRGQMSPEEAAENSVAREFAARKRALDKAMAEERAAVETQARAIEAILGSGQAHRFKDELTKRGALLASAKAKLAALEAEAEAARKIAAIDREAINQKRTAEKKAIEDTAKVEKKAIEEVASVREQSDREAMSRQKELRDQMEKGYGAIARAAGEAAGKAAAALQDGLAASGEAAAQARVEALRAVVDAEDGVAEAGQDAASAAKEKLQANKESVEAVRQESALIAKRADITKRFANFGGTSPFGFGAGQVGTGLGDIGADASRARRAAGDIPGKGGGAAAALAAGVAQLPEVSADIAAAEAAIAKIPPLFERLAGATTSFAATTKSVVGDLGRSTDRAVSGLRSAQDAMAAEVRALAKAIERAGGGTGGGD